CSAGDCPPGLTCNALQICVEPGDDPRDAAIVDAPVDISVDAVAPPIPKHSCLMLPSNCGAAGTDSCCNSPMVPGGTFYRGYDAASDANAGDMTAPATVSSFRLDKYEITVGRFRNFVDAGMGTQAQPPPPGAGAHDSIPGSGWNESWNANLIATTDA